MDKQMKLAMKLLLQENVVRPAVALAVTAGRDSGDGGDDSSSSSGSDGPPNQNRDDDDDWKVASSSPKPCYSLEEDCCQEMKPSHKPPLVAARAAAAANDALEAEMIQCAISRAGDHAVAQSLCLALQLQSEEDRREQHFQLQKAKATKCQGNMGNVRTVGKAEFEAAARIPAGLGGKCYYDGGDGEGRKLWGGDDYLEEFDGGDDDDYAGDERLWWGRFHIVVRI